MDNTQESNGTDNSGPTLSEHVQELQGSFPNDASLQDAMGRLTLLGIDHADFSLPHPDPAFSTPDEGASAATDAIDTQQIRTMSSGITGTAAGMAVAGVMMATGGLAAPIVAAAAGAAALGTVAATSGAGVAADNASVSERDRLGAAGKLILAVRVRSQETAQSAEQAMREAGATAVTRVNTADHALTRGVSAASWTGS